MDCVHPNCLLVFRWVSSNGQLSWLFSAGWEETRPFILPCNRHPIFIENHSCLWGCSADESQNNFLLLFCYAWIFCWVSRFHLPVCTCTKSRFILQASWQQTKLTIPLPATDEVLKAGCSNLNSAQVTPC